MYVPGKLDTSFEAGVVGLPLFGETEKLLKFIIPVGSFLKIVK